MFMFIRSVDVNVLSFAMSHTRFAMNGPLSHPIPMVIRNFSKSAAQVRSTGVLPMHTGSASAETTF